MDLKYEAAVLGATGVVGQRFVELLQKHPWFEVGVLAASERSAGKKFEEACGWSLESEMPEDLRETTVVNTTLGAVEGAASIDIVFSCLPSSVAGRIELDFARKYPVISKVGINRLADDVPLIIPEVNPEHMDIIPEQRKRRGWEGFLSADPNCSTTQLAMTLKPLQRFGLKKVIVSTMQALSGAGYPGLSSLDINDNLLPHITGEEEKVEKESLKILGRMVDNRFEDARYQISATCNRINVRDGHTECVNILLEEDISEGEAKAALRGFSSEPQELSLPTAPARPIVVREEEDRPQPRRDRWEGNGMSVVVGRLRKDSVFTIKFVCLSHNTVRGAAGDAILQAELYKSKGVI
ncbi:MAG: aspartate-semialdehyde dehydrogenase [Thermoplasmata archaeon]